MASIELRIPLWRTSSSQPIISIAPFIDFGKSWNKQRRERALSAQAVALPAANNYLLGLGLGLRLQPYEWLSADIYFAEQLQLTRDETYFDMRHRSIQLRVNAVVF